MMSVVVASETCRPRAGSHDLYWNTPGTNTKPSTKYEECVSKAAQIVSEELISKVKTVFNRNSRHCRDTCNHLVSESLHTKNSTLEGSCAINLHIH